MFKHLGLASNIGELIDMLSDIPRDLEITAAGGDCHIILDEGKGIILDEKDYTDEWNEEEEEWLWVDTLPKQERSL